MVSNDDEELQKENINKQGYQIRERKKRKEPGSFQIEAIYRFIALIQYIEMKYRKSEKMKQ